MKKTYGKSGIDEAAKLVGEKAKKTLDKIDEKARRDGLMVTLAGRKQGKLYFNIGQVESDPETFTYLLSVIGFFPFRVEARKDIDQFECIGISPSFDRIPIGAATPTYSIEVKNEGRTIDVKRI